MDLGVSRIFFAPMLRRYAEADLFYSVLTGTKSF